MTFIRRAERDWQSHSFMEARQWQKMLTATANRASIGEARKHVWPSRALIVVPLLILWVLLATDDDSNIALVRNDVVQDSSGERTWRGTMGNTTDSQYREITVTIRFLDDNDQKVGEVKGSADVLEPGESFDLQASLAPAAVAMQVYSLEWRTGRKDKRTDPPLGPSGAMAIRSRASSVALSSSRCNVWSEIPDGGLRLVASTGWYRGRK